MSGYVGSPEEVVKLYMDEVPDKENACVLEKGSNYLGNIAKGTVLATTLNPKSASAIVAVEKPGILVFTNNYFPGWKVKVDGVPASIFLANYIQQAVLVNPGHHTIVFTFFHPILLFLVFPFLVTIFCVIDLLIYSRHYKRR